MKKEAGFLLLAVQLNSVLRNENTDTALRMETLIFPLMLAPTPACDSQARCPSQGSQAFP